MEKDILNLAIEKKYSEFSDAIKSTLKDKLANHEVVSNYVDSVDKIAAYKDAFAEINTSGE